MTFSNPASRPKALASFHRSLHVVRGTAPSGRAKQSESVYLHTRHRLPPNAKQVGMFESLIKPLDGSHPSRHLQRKRYQLRWDWHLRLLVYAMMPPAGCLLFVQGILYFYDGEVDLYKEVKKVVDVAAEESVDPVAVMAAVLREEVDVLSKQVGRLERELAQQRIATAVVTSLKKKGAGGGVPDEDDAYQTASDSEVIVGHASSGEREVVSVVPTKSPAVADPTSEVDGAATSASGKSITSTNRYLGNTGAVGGPAGEKRSNVSPASTMSSEGGRKTKEGVVTGIHANLPLDNPPGKPQQSSEMDKPSADQNPS